MFPCTNSACSSSGEPTFVPPGPRFFGSESLLKGSSCRGGQCKPDPYLTLSKYWPFLDRWTSTATAKKCARRYLLKAQLQQRRWFSKHYKAGFTQAFVDVANGESGEVPPVPPPKYWNTHYRTDAGKQCVETWFDGYRSGAALASGEFASMRTIGASYDWSIEKPRGPFISTGPFISGECAQSGCATGNCSTGNPQQFSPPSPMGISNTPVNPQATNGVARPPQSGSFDGRYGPAYGQAPYLLPSPGQVPESAPSQIPMQPGPGAPSLSNPVPGLPAPSAVSPFGSAQSGAGGAAQGPGYSSPGSLPATSGAVSGGGSFAGQGRASGGVMKPGFAGPSQSQNAPRGQVQPGKLGPPPGFESDPPVFQVSPPGR